MLLHAVSKRTRKVNIAKIRVRSSSSQRNLVFPSPSVGLHTEALFELPDMGCSFKARSLPPENEDAMLRKLKTNNPPKWLDLNDDPSPLLRDD